MAFSRIALALALVSVKAADDCMDSTTWHKNGEEAKDCNWVSKFAEKRCMVKGAVDKELASSACKKSCGGCAMPSLRDQMCIPMFDAPLKPECVDAIEQAPADVTKGAVGPRAPRGSQSSEAARSDDASSTSVAESHPRRASEGSHPRRVSRRDLEHALVQHRA